MDSCSLPRVVHVSFGTSKFRQALTRLRRSARKVGIEDIRVYRPDHPSIRRAREENPKIMGQRRGAGYWLWKPYILLDTLNGVAEGTVIVYSDAGQRYIADPSPLIDLAVTRDVVLFHNNGGQLQRAWTKRDCFVLMQADAPEYWDALQLDASIQIYRASLKARNFLLDLREAMRDPRLLCDGPNTCGLPNFEDFREHRHDQSITTILAMKHGIETFPSPKVVVKGVAVTGARQSYPFSRNEHVVFEHHRCRNEPLRVYWRRLVGEFLGIAEVLAALLDRLPDGSDRVV
jgi:hypothetical protein